MPQYSLVTFAVTNLVRPRGMAHLESGYTKCLATGGFMSPRRFAHAFPEWGPHCNMRTWKLRAAVCGLNDEPAALCNAPRKYLSDKDRSNEEVGSTFCVSDHGPCL